METTQLINVINLPRRTDRLKQFDSQSSQQMFGYRVWLGIETPQIHFLGIVKAHKQIVQDAKNKGLKNVTIAEDDCVFSAPGAWEHYIKNEPEDYDIYFGMVYQSTIENSRIIFGLSGLTLYTVHERFYDNFLALNDMNNFDREIGRFAHKYKYIVCNPMVAFQSDGWSDNKKVDATYGHLLYGIQLFGR